MQGNEEWILEPGSERGLRGVALASLVRGRQGLDQILGPGGGDPRAPALDALGA